MKLRWEDCVKVGGSIFLLYLAVHYWDRIASLAGSVLSAAFPLILGGAIAYLLNILMSKYEQHFFSGASVAKLRRPVCLLLAFLTLIAIVVLIFGLILPQLGECIGVIADGLPGFMEKAVGFADELGVFSEETLNALTAIDWKSQITKVVQFVSSGIGDVVDVVVNAVSSVFSWIVTGLLSIIFAIYLLSGKETLAGQCNRLINRYCSETAAARIRYFVRILDDCFHRYIVGQCTEAVILGTLCAAGMALLRLPYALMVGTLVAFTALIPVAGAYIGAGVGAFMILTVDPMKALIFLVFLVVLQQLEGNLIYPRVVGSSMGLPGIWVLAAVTVGGGIAGVPGMLLGVPLAAALYRILRDDVRKAEITEENENPEP